MIYVCKAKNAILKSNFMSHIHILRNYHLILIIYLFWVLHGSSNFLKPSKMNNLVKFLPDESLTSNIHFILSTCTYHVAIEYICGKYYFIALI